MDELSYCARFYFSLALIYTLLAASISHFLTAALNFHVFLPTKFVEKDTTLLLFFLFKSPGGHAISFQQPLPQGAFRGFSRTISKARKKRPGDKIAFQIKPWVAFGLPYLSWVSCTCRLSYFTFVCLWFGRTDGRAGEREYETWLPKFLGCIGYQIFLPMVLRFVRERAPLIIKVNYNYHNKISQNPLRIFF